MTIFGVIIFASFILSSCGGGNTNTDEQKDNTDEVESPYKGNSGSFVDERDNQTYNWVRIGEQVWMSENLNVEKFRNGDIIPHAKTEEEWKKARASKQPAWCYYDNEPANGEKYGKLYNWYAVNDSRGLTPAGWHIPSDAEWTQLIEYLEGKNGAGKKMKSTNGWKDNGNGTNECNFLGLPCGIRSYFGSFNYFGNYAYWWSSTESNTDFAYTRSLYFESADVFRGSLGKGSGFSVRCLKD